MQARVSFNAGEFSPELSERADLEKYALGCSCLENWEVGQLGGIKRRRGMRPVTTALSSISRIVPYVYSYAEGAGLRFLVELTPTSLRVLTLDGETCASFKDGGKLKDGSTLRYDCDPSTVRYTQINRLLIFTSLYHRPMVLKYDGTVWEFEPWEFKHVPWKSNHDEQQDTEVVVSYDGSEWRVAFSDKADKDDTDASLEKADMLRVSYRTEPVTQKSAVGNLLGDWVIVSPTVPTSAGEGEVFAVREEEGASYFVCISDFPASSYVEGLESPIHYSNAFRQVDSSSGFEDITPVYSLKELGRVEKGEKVAIKSENWHYYTCIRTYDSLEEGFVDYEDFPEYFVEGIAVGDAIPCKGTWAFKCSGTWYGEYAVKRCYDTSELTGDWELRGTSRSYNDSASNVGIEGDEKTEECYLRLFVNRSRCLGTDVKAGFPADSCHNRLVVDSYLHDITLTATPTASGTEWGSDGVFLPAEGSRIRSKDWSWAAFSDRNGFPLLAVVYNQRLVFASTIEQPQTLWMSRVDDLNNFLDGDEDDSAICGLTLNTSTQDPICWLKPHKRSLLLGTTSAEYVIEPGSTVGGITAANAMNQIHSDRGSDGQSAITMSDKVIYIARGGKKAYEYGYNYEADGYIARDLSLLAPHIGRYGGMFSGSAVEEPNPMALFVLGNGQLALCTYNSMQEVRAWHRWTTDGIIRDVCAMPDGGSDDKIYLLVERDNVLWLEVVDEDSPYVDGEDCDYASVFITNNMISPFENKVEGKPSRTFSVCFGSEFSLKDGYVRATSNGGVDWYAFADDRQTLPAGWYHEVPAPGGNKFERKIGILVSGNRGAEILAVQG